MKNISKILVPFILVISFNIYSDHHEMLNSTPTQGGLSVITINTDNPADYVSWLKKSTPIFAEAWGDNVASSGICTPISGGEREGNHYVWSLSPSLAATMASVPGSDASTDKAVKKISKKRTVERREVYEVRKITSQVNIAGQLTAQYNLLSTPSSVSAYVEAITVMESAAAKNGFSDIEIAVFQASGAGDRAGMVMASVQAPSTQRLGEFLNHRNAGWMAEAMKDFPSLRKSEHDWLLTCEVIYNN